MGDWGLVIGNWGLGPIPNPQSPIPNPQSPIPIISRELIFQKTFIEQKNANSKLYFKGYEAELDSM